MASRLLLKLKLNANLPLRFLRNPPPSILTHFVAPIAFHSNNLKLLGTTQNLFARQMGTSRSSSSSAPRGNPKASDEEDADEFDDDDEDDDFDDGTFELDENDLDDDDYDEEEEEPPKKKTSGKK